jgi:predicted nucleotidyltransferase
MHEISWAEGLLSQYANLRDQWLERAHLWLQAHDEVIAAWLVGSLGRNDADQWSDVDLIVVANAPFLTKRRSLLRELGEVMLEWDAPQNAAMGAMHYCTVYDLSQLPFSVDWHIWPEGTSKPSDARTLFERMEFPTSTETFETLQKETSARNKGRVFPEPSELDRHSVRLFMLLPICKDLVRGWTESAELMLKGLCAGTTPEPTAEAWISALQDCLNEVSKGFPAHTVAKYQTLIDVTRATVRKVDVD